MAIQLTEAQKRYIAKLQPGQRATGKVKKLADFGAFVSIGLVSGLVHNNNIRWGKVEDPSDFLRVGQQVEVVILEVDYISHKLSLGIKQLLEDPWEKFAAKYKPGDTLAANVVIRKPYGVLLEVIPGITALLHKSEIRDTFDGNELYDPGNSFEVTILEIERENKSLKVGITG